jgi:flagellar motility protein MotE (MotC chaperone)
MGNKLLTLIILVSLAAVTFAVTYAVARWLGATPAPAAAGTTPGGAEGAANAGAAAVQEAPRIEEKHLYDLIKEVRQRIRDCQKREADLAEQDKRLQMTRQLLEKESQDLETLRTQLTASVTRLKEAQADLEKTRIAIDQKEQANLKRTAAVYDTMDAAAAAKIVEGMCANQQDADAVKVLFYMKERAVGKLLAEITDKGLAARLCEQTKRVKE